MLRSCIKAIVFTGVAVTLTACASNPTGLAANPDQVKKLEQQEKSKPGEAPGNDTVVLEGKPADSISYRDIINRSREGVTRTGEIYLMRGLANVFSRGIDEMAVELRSRGYDAVNFSYASWQPVADDIVARSKRKRVSLPVIIIGHSLGGNESSKFANHLAEKGVPVGLVVAFDPVETGYVGKSIGTVVNYYLPKSADNRILAKSDFKGKLNNIDVSVEPEITHTNVEKNPRFQNATYKSIANLTTKKRPRVAKKRKATR